MHRGAMVVPCRTRGALRSAGPGGMLACADIMSSFRSGRSAVVFPSGWGRRPRGPEGRRRLPGFAWSSPVGIGGIAGMRMI